MRENPGIDPDEFQMWRTLLAFALVDGILSLEEQNVLAQHMRKTPFSRGQLKALRTDMNRPQDVEQLFRQIKSEELKEKFCKLARTLVWSDGDIERQEKAILKRLACLEDPKHRSILRRSANSEFIASYTEKYQNIKKYEDTAFMGPDGRKPLFRTRA